MTNFPYFQDYRFAVVGREFEILKKFKLGKCLIQ